VTAWSASSCSSADTVGGLAGDGELGEADRGADLLELARGVVGARGELGDELDLLARGHVLLLAHDAQLVLGEDLELVDVAAGVLRD
jgi:hypothetical protein